MPHDVPVVPLVGEDLRASEEGIGASHVEGWASQIDGFQNIEQINIEALPFNRQTQRLSVDALQPMAALLGKIAERAVEAGDKLRLQEAKAWVDGLRMVGSLRGQWREIALDPSESLSNPDPDKMLSLFAEHGFSKADLETFYSGGGDNVKPFEDEVRRLYGSDVPELSKLISWMAGKVSSEQVANRLRIMATGVLYRDMSSHDHYPDNPGNRGEALWQIVNGVGGEQAAREIVLDKPVGQMTYLERCFKELSNLSSFRDFYETVYAKTDSREKTAFEIMNEK